MDNNHLWNRPVLKVPDLNKRLEIITPSKEWFDANDPIKIIEAFNEHLLNSFKEG